MNNEEILKRLETKDKNYPELKKKYPIFAEAFKGILRDIRNEAIQEAQKQKDDEIENYKTALKLLTEDYEELKSSLSKGDAHTQRTKVTEPLDNADVREANASAPKDNDKGNFTITEVYKVKDNPENFFKLAFGIIGCGRMFKPWGNLKEESSWKCGDVWNGKQLLCPECEKKNKNFVASKDERREE